MLQATKIETAKFSLLTIEKIGELWYNKINIVIIKFGGQERFNVMGTIFIAGTYGVGKSTLCNKLSKILNVREYSAGDLISAVNGENYGANKVVSDKETNQKILALQVKKLHEVSPNIILAGHFCLFGADGNVECLPDEIFCDLAIDNIILLEASLSQIISNLFVRDKKKYSEKQILALQTKST